MINTGIGQRCDSEISVPETSGLSLLVAEHDKTAYPMCQRSQINSNSVW